jgi:hypothetical protein
MSEEVISYIQQIDKEVNEQIKQEKIDQDFNYKLYDTDTYGIYNGINEFHIEELVWDVKRKLNTDIFLFADDLKDHLNADTELKAIAVDTYRPYPEHMNWSDETKMIYRENVARRVASGYGIIPNKIMREKITKLIEAEIEKEKIKQQKKDKRIQELLSKAKDTNEPQIISQGTVPCSDRHEECNTDIVTVYAMPDGTVKTEQCHTW